MSDTPVPTEVQKLADQLSESNPMRRGSLTKRWVKCNKGGCRCRESDEARHGPYYSVSRVVNGRTQSRWLNAEEAKIVQEQVAQGRQFRKDIEAYWQACERWADAQLETVEELASDEAAKKRASKRPLKRKSTRKSTSS